ncbi:MAG: hypothetical protein EBV15_09855, partial [Bacteroidetes bacterium]|nr:hypothetical protein [Bacteroidota bacterium]
MTGLIICMGLYLAALIYARMVLGKGLDSLSTEEKGKFLEITASTRKWSLIFLVVIITLFLLASRFGKFSFVWIFSAYIASLLLFNNGVIVAREYVIFDYDCPASLIEEASKVTPGIESPTISPTKDAEWLAVRALVRRSETNEKM